MTERKKKVKTNGGKLVDGTVVDIVESTERFSMVRLEDGTTLRTKSSVLEAIRIDGQWDKEDNPLYVIKQQNIVAIVESPENLKRKVH